MSRLAFVSVLSLLAAGASVGTAVAATPPLVSGYAGQQRSSIAGCPNLEWRLARHENGDVTGFFYYSDASGASEVTGTIDQAGHFRLTLTSAIGKGPVGTVTGTKSPNGVLDATMTGEGCANMKLRFNPFADMRQFFPFGAH